MKLVLVYEMSTYYLCTTIINYMTIDELKERIEAQCMKHGFEVKKFGVSPMGSGSIYCRFVIKECYYSFYAPDTELLLERVDWECRVIKAYQSSATNGLDV